jgi:hypothetical protein
VQTINTVKMSPSKNYDDEALARALQIEYEREYRRRSMQRHLDVDGPTIGTDRSMNRNTNYDPSSPPNPPPTLVLPSAPLSSYFYDDSGNNELSHNVVGAHRGTTATTQLGNVGMSDATYAQALEQEMIEEESRRKQRKQHLQQQRDSFRATSGGMNRGSNYVTRVSTIRFVEIYQR